MGILSKDKELFYIAKEKIKNAFVKLKNALNKFNSYLRKEKELINLYESKYGPMTISSPVQTDNWLWNNSPWPWEVQN